MVLSVLVLLGWRNFQEHSPPPPAQAHPASWCRATRHIVTSTRPRTNPQAGSMRAVREKQFANGWNQAVENLAKHGIVEGCDGSDSRQRILKGNVLSRQGETQ